MAKPDMMALEESAYTTAKQVFTFQVFGIRNDAPCSFSVVAETPGRAQELVRRAYSGFGVTVSGCGPGIPVLDPCREVFDKESAAVFLQMHVDTFDKLMEGDKPLLPPMRKGQGYGRWTKMQILSAVTNRQRSLSELVG